MSETINLKLTNRQANTLLQAALFSCTTDITADWKSEDLHELVQVSKLLESKIDDLDLEPLEMHFFKDCNQSDKPVFEDSYTNEILEHFGSNIRVTDVSNKICENYVD
jgi:hypothetical protein